MDTSKKFVIESFMCDKIQQKHKWVSGDFVVEVFMANKRLGYDVIGHIGNQWIMGVKDHAPHSHFVVLFRQDQIQDKFEHQNIQLIKDFTQWADSVPEVQGYSLERLWLNYYMFYKYQLLLHKLWEGKDAIRRVEEKI